MIRCRRIPSIRDTVPAKSMERNGCWVMSSITQIIRQCNCKMLAKYCNMFAFRPASAVFDPLPTLPNMLIQSGSFHQAIAAIEAESTCCPSGHRRRHASRVLSWCGLWQPNPIRSHPSPCIPVRSCTSTKAVRFFNDQLI